MGWFEIYLIIHLLTAILSYGIANYTLDINWQRDVMGLTVGNMFLSLVGGPLVLVIRLIFILIDGNKFGLKYNIFK